MLAAQLEHARALPAPQPAQDAPRGESDASPPYRVRRRHRRDTGPAGCGGAPDAALTSEELAVLAAWFETVALPPPPFRSTPRAETSEPEAWRRQVLWDIHFGPRGLYWKTALGELRWLAQRIAPPDIQRAAHVDELAERPGQAF